ncbi:hypothetical protein JCGZ_09544 [Jatropha curcas]|uniref:Uncharacterized protein n=1 Tax=Jatropha curcas TaxID=180498 RepID=A0A067KWW1_JATCU|nr:hypothetical protein JCGZ_09544 [Jatropha curcas]
MGSSVDKDVRVLVNQSEDENIEVLESEASGGKSYARIKKLKGKYTELEVKKVFLNGEEEEGNELVTNDPALEDLLSSLQVHQDPPTQDSLVHSKAKHQKILGVLLGVTVAPLAKQDSHVESSLGEELVSSLGEFLL